MRERIIRMNLNGQRLFCEQQLEQEMRGGRGGVRALKTEPADPNTARLNFTPRQEVRAPPGLAYNPRRGMFDRHVSSTGARCSSCRGIALVRSAASALMASSSINRLI